MLQQGHLEPIFAAVIKYCCGMSKTTMGQLCLGHYKQKAIYGGIRTVSFSNLRFFG